VEGFPGPLVEFGGDFEEAFWAVGVEVGALREMLAPVRLFYICQGAKWPGVAFKVRKSWRAR
jgi:hypothetical protein